MFSDSDRKAMYDYVLHLASSDPRVVAGAAVGSLASGGGDRWSDLDLTFAVQNGLPVRVILDEWTSKLVAEFGAVHLFDVPQATTVYRVLLFPECLELDLSCTPASEFGAGGPKFKLLFGAADGKPYIPQPPSAQHFFGYGVHHALRARACIERGRVWQAEYWISALRDCALDLACRRRGLTTAFGRAYDELPADVHGAVQEAIVRSLDRDGLRRALKVAITALLNEAQEAAELAQKLQPQLREFIESVSPIGATGTR